MTPIDEPNRRGWMVVGAATVAMMAGFGMMTTVASLMNPLEVEFGWMRADMAFAYTLASLGAAIGGPVWGHLADRAGARPVAIGGALVIGGGLLLLSQQSDLPTIQAIYLVMGALGFASLYAPVLAAVGLWFDRRRGLAIGIVTAGGTLGQGLVPFVLQSLLDVMTWRQAVVVLGSVYLLVFAPAVALITKPPMLRPGSAAPGRQGGWALPPVVSVTVLSLAAILCCMCMAVPLVHLLPLLVDAGRSPTTAASIMLTVMLSGSLGRISFGLIADRIGSLASYAVASALQTATVYWFVTLQDLPSLYGLAVIFGFGFSGVMTSLILCIRDAVPPRAAGLSTALVTMFAWFGMGSGGYLGGYCFDLSGTYSTSFAGAVAFGTAHLVVVLGLGLALWLRRPGSKRGEPLGRRAPSSEFVLGRWPMFVRSLGNWPRLRLHARFIPIF
jgi:MFS family permease